MFEILVVLVIALIVFGPMLLKARSVPLMPDLTDAPTA